MTQDSLIQIFRFLFFLLLQILIFSKINLFGYVNPYPYVLFVLLFPIGSSKNFLLIASFLLGLTLDIFLNTGGVHAGSSVLLAWMRENYIKFSFGLNYQYQSVKFFEKINNELISYLLLGIATHHLCMFFLDIFSLPSILSILTRTLWSTLFTFVICIGFIQLMKPTKR